MTVLRNYIGNEHINNGDRLLMKGKKLMVEVIINYMIFFVWDEHHYNFKWNWKIDTTFKGIHSFI